jgi:type I restriction enzyme R subunit
MTDYSGSHLVEQSAIALFQSLSYFNLNCFHETFGDKGMLGRQTSAEVVLIPGLRAELTKLNLSFPPLAIDFTIEELTRDLLLPKLISGEIDVEGLDINISHEVTK